MTWGGSCSGMWIKRWACSSRWSSSIRTPGAARHTKTMWPCSSDAQIPSTAFPMPATEQVPVSRVGFRCRVSLGFIPP